MLDCVVQVLVKKAIIFLQVMIFTDVFEGLTAQLISQICIAQQCSYCLGEQLRLSGGSQQSGMAVEYRL